MTTTAITTAEQLWKHHPPGRCELVRGELRLMTPPGSEHGWLTAEISSRMVTFVNQRKLGRVLAGDPGFIIQRNPDSVRAPDVAFISLDRFGGKLPKTFFDGPPDLAIEVISPDDRASEVQEKTEDWLMAGCREVWLIDPQKKTAIQCTLSGETVVRNNVERLRSPLLPGFELRIDELFEQPGLT